tara:strand:- start:517 stop:657 length:141 start_codon:yes stop_codon:yes gene_type:complete
MNAAISMAGQLNLKLEIELRSINGSWTAKKYSTVAIISSTNEQSGK